MECATGLCRHGSITGKFTEPVESPVSPLNLPRTFFTRTAVAQHFYCTCFVNFVFPHAPLGTYTVRRSSGVLSSKRDVLMADDDDEFQLFPQVIV